ncbi:SDR family oxidoreductase [Paenibacillus sp.]|uniref:SDR family NAD(P)-dependent oxidoreductase n=1 Tax=Paenibacillus sp. TaxID=58172 RepID=UPI00281140C3|nr:SDR family oxidoreductase [Paenibacillus sp.]
MRLEGKTAIVTGAGSGIGEAIAALFANRGANVVVADRNEAAAARVAREINEGSGRAIAIRTDVSLDADVRKLARATIDTFGAIDVVVNNASVILPGPIEHVEEADWQRVMDSNVKSVFLTTKACIPELRRRRGSIVNLASLNGLLGQRNNPVYSASKGAVVALTKSLALDYAADGVRVNCICPAGVMTPLLEDWVERQPDPAAAARSLGEMHPLGRCATPEEIARAALYLACDDAGFVTGVALPVDGGASLGY